MPRRCYCDVVQYQVFGAGYGGGKAAGGEPGLVFGVVRVKISGHDGKVGLIGGWRGDGEYVLVVDCIGGAEAFGLVYQGVYCCGVMMIGYGDLVLNSVLTE